MEKQPFAEPPLARPNRPNRIRFALSFVLLGLGLICLSSSDSSWPIWTSKDKQPLIQKKAFSWDTTPAFKYLKYQDCYQEYGHFQCARLELPMDYWNGTTNATIGLAVIRRPASVPVTDSRYGGPVLLNPGGPGGSGIGLVLGAGGQIGKFLDQEDGKFFDIVSFDPRGVAFTTPHFQCIEDCTMSRSWGIRMMEEGILGSSDASLGRLWSMISAQGQSCSILPGNGTESIKQFMTTASVARDMVGLIEAHGEWREQEAARLLGKGCACHAARKRGVACEEVSERLRYVEGEEKIQYWGFSYGTYLGLTYSAMFPDKIHRLVVDGVVDAYDYRKALWFDNLVDTEKDLGTFYYHCARAGYPACKLANKTGETTEAGVKERVWNITNSLYHNPLPIIHEAYPDVITYSDIRSMIFSSLYSPIGAFPLVAQVLADVEEREGDFFAQLLKPTHEIDCPGLRCGINGMESSTKPTRNDIRSLQASTGLGIGETTVAIACTDGEDQTWMDRDDFSEHLKNVTELSPSVGPIWAMLRMGCAHWSVRPYNRFTADWAGKTSHPILLLGNTADPVTPLRAAKKMSKGFEDAVVLTQDSPGHCTLAAPSKCTVGYVRKYFQTGELPPKNTTCAVDALPFGPGPGKEIALDAEALELKEATESLQAALHNSGGAFMRQAIRQKHQLAWYN